VVAMELGLKPSVFTDKRLLKILDPRNIISVRPSTFYGRGSLGEVILTDYSSIKVLFEHFPSIAGLKSRDLIILSFYEKSFIGEFSFSVENSPFDIRINLYFNDSRFLNNFASQDAFLSKSESIEKLMEYPDFKEWLVWNII
jgi:hypothetical protein